MASLNTSTNGPSISKSYQSVVNAPPPTGAAASSPTYGQWAVFSVSAPLANAFQDASNKESVLKVQSTGEGELVDLIDEFSDGRIQFAFVKVKDSNTGLPKSALIAWCGEGVPERTKGYFTSHLTAVTKLLHGYHVQITARSDRDLTPDAIIQKVADASGSKYSSSSTAPPPVAATKPTVASKPVFTPTQSSGFSSGYNPVARNLPPKNTNVDEDGWGADAPQVTRTQLEKVAPAYQPTRVNMRELTSQMPTASAFSSDQADDRPGVVKGAYQPVGKVDIAAIRRQAKDSGALKDDRPETVKGAYEPIGKVDIAAIRAKAQKPDDSAGFSRPPPVSSQSTGRSDEQDAPPRSLVDRSAAFSQGPERLTSLPKPKVANKFGGGSTFTGTKAPTPGGFEAKPLASAAPVGTASRTFADQGGKTPAQIWAEKKAREKGDSASGEPPVSPSYDGRPPLASQPSGEAGWRSSYTGKSWAPVQISHTGRESIGQQVTGEGARSVEEDETPSSPAGGISSIRDRFSGAPPMGAPATFDRGPPPAPEPDTSNKPNRGIPIPGLPTPPVQPRSPSPEEEPEPASPIRVAAPVSASAHVPDAREEQFSPPPAMPETSIARALPTPAAEEEDDEPARGPDPGRTAAVATAATTMGAQAVESAPAPSAEGGGERARAEYEYEAAEDNEVSLREGELVTDIQRIDPDWWLVKNEAGQTGLVPSNYLTVVDDDEAGGAAAPPPAAEPAATAPAHTPAQSQGATATALYDYEAGEDNELAFPENAIIHNVTFPDEDWWHGEYNGHAGLFPANYTKLNE
ncbi:actin binding protein [Cladophialophora chaetospira]|uniref:Actin binding protein n=1 Tax=Cladophialophora chaetospira TaxID=386627 RepID=A0AA38XC10_9EURO|nr:actin binding protein [Cladophialophora chaetospira]